MAWSRCIYHGSTLNTHAAVVLQNGILGRDDVIGGLVPRQCTVRALDNLNHDTGS